MELSWLKGWLPGVLVLVLLALIPHVVRAQTPDKVSSQCFQHPGTSFVTLYCGLGKVVRVREAFHGAHRDHSRDCGHKHGDCTVDVLSEYDWSRCETRHSCVQLVRQVPDMPGCGTLRSTYLQVRYACVPGTETSTDPLQADVTSDADENDQTEDPLKPVTFDVGVKAANICLNKTLHMPQLYIQSPGYPHFYPTGLDCRCDIIAPEGDNVIVTFTDVMLAPYKELCGDWLLLESPDYPGASVVMCEDKAAGKHRLQSRSNQVALQFHAQSSLGIKDMRGFIVKVTASRDSELGMQCYKTSAASALASIPPDVAVDPDRPFALPPTHFGDQGPSGSAPCRRWTVLQLLLAVVLQASIHILHTSS